MAAARFARAPPGPPKPALRAGRGPNGVLEDAVAAVSSSTRVRIVPGRGEAVSDLGVLFATCANVAGLDFDQRFAGLSFGAQVARVSALIEEAEPQALLVGRSFGAWLMVHALLGRTTAFDGTVLLLAPVLGYGRSGQAGFMAPRARMFWNEVEAGRPMPASRMVLMAGQHDPQCPIELARRLASAWPIELHELLADHSLDAWNSTGMARRVAAALRREV